jgi:5-(carboxyamino)imidazole ribonucleotide synthase
LTFDASMTCQFEQQLRAICGLPLGATTQQCAGAAMANLLGDWWNDGEPNWQAALAFPDVKLHLYGKQTARPGRKMGHLTAMSSDPEKAARTVVEARNALGNRKTSS